MQVASGGPSALLLSRQSLPFIERDASTIENIARGGYILRDVDQPQAAILATGSEVALALSAQDALASQNIPVRVVSMPCVERFDEQDAAWREMVLPADLPVVAVEAGSTTGWYKYTGRTGHVVGIDTYGESAPANVLFDYFAITAERVEAAVKQLISGE